MFHNFCIFIDFMLYNIFSFLSQKCSIFKTEPKNRQSFTPKKRTKLRIIFDLCKFFGKKETCCETKYNPFIKSVHAANDTLQKTGHILPPRTYKVQVLFNRKFCCWDLLSNIKKTIVKYHSLINRNNRSSKTR